MQACLPVPSRASWWSEGHGAATGPHPGSRLRPAGGRVGSSVTRSLQGPQQGPQTGPLATIHRSPRATPARSCTPGQGCSEAGRGNCTSITRERSAQARPALQGHPGSPQIPDARRPDTLPLVPKSGQRTHPKDCWALPGGEDLVASRTWKGHDCSGLGGSGWWGGVCAQGWQQGTGRRLREPSTTCHPVQPEPPLASWALPWRPGPTRPSGTLPSADQARPLLVAGTWASSAGCRRPTGGGWRLALMRLLVPGTMKGFCRHSVPKGGRTPYVRLPWPSPTPAPLSQSLQTLQGAGGTDTVPLRLPLFLPAPGVNEPQSHSPSAWGHCDPGTTGTTSSGAPDSQRGQHPGPSGSLEDMETCLTPGQRPGEAQGPARGKGTRSGWQPGSPTGDPLPSSFGPASTLHPTLAEAGRGGLPGVRGMETACKALHLLLATTGSQSQRQAALRQAAGALCKGHLQGQAHPCLQVGADAHPTVDSEQSKRNRNQNLGLKKSPQWPGPTLLVLAREAGPRGEGRST